MDLSAKRQSWFGHFYQTLVQEGDGTMKQDFDNIEKQVGAFGEKMKRFCSKIFHDGQHPERDVMRVNPHLDSEGYPSTSGSANSVKSVENEPGKSIPNQSQVACPLENYMGHDLSKPEFFILDPELDPQRRMPVVESNDELVQMISEQLQVTCHLDPFQEPIEPQTSNSSSQNLIEVPACSSDVGLSDEHTSFDSIKNQGHTLDNPSEEPEQSQPQTSNPSSRNLFEVPESSSDLGLLDNLTAFDSVKNLLGHTFNDPNQEPTGSQTSDHASPNLFEVPESSSELELLDKTFAFDSVKNLPGHFFDDSSQEKSESQTHNPSKNLFELPESSDMVLLDKPTAFGSVNNQQRHMYNSPKALVSVHLLEGGQSRSSLGCTDGALSEEKAPKFWKENAMPGGSSAPEVYLISSVEKHLCEADFLSIHLPSDDNANTASLGPNKLSPANSVHAEEDLVLSDNFTVETVCSIGASNTIASSVMSSPVASYEQEAKTTGLEHCIHLPSDDNANTASLGPNKISPANSVHVEEDLVPSDNFTVETVCSIGVSNTIASCDMSSPVASYEQEAKTMGIEHCIHLSSDDNANNASLGSHKLSPANSVHAEEDLVHSDNFTVETVCDIGASNTIASSDMSSPVASYEQEAKTMGIEHCIHLPSDDNANNASLGSNKLSPANSVHAEEDLVHSDNFTVETVCSIGGSNTIASSDMSSPVASYEQEAKMTGLESLSNAVEVESYESEILPEVSFQRGSFCDDEVGIARCIPHRSSFTPFALSGGSVENASGFSDATSLTEAYRKEHIQFDDSAEFHDLSFSSDEDKKVKLEESCVALDSRELYALSLRIQRTRSLKKKIMDTFAPRQRTVREYEQLGIWYEDSQIESEFNREIEHTTSLPAISASSVQEHQIDSDWELL